jgi:hypothetical protein
MRPSAPAPLTATQAMSALTLLAAPQTMHWFAPSRRQ